MRYSSWPAQQRIGIRSKRADIGCGGKAHQSEPTEDQVEELVEHLDVYPEFPEEAVCRAVDIIEVPGGVDRGEERAVQPTTTL